MYRKCKTIKDLFFPIDYRNLYWEDYEGQPNLFGKICYSRTKDYYGIVDVERHHLFTIASSDYKAITNEEAYACAEWLARRVFMHNDNDNFELRPIEIKLRDDRGACIVSLQRKVDIEQPLLNMGWHAFLQMTNSYTKYVALRYFIGFRYKESNISILFGQWDLLKDFKVSKNSNVSLKEQISKFLEDRHLIIIKEIEKSFYQKIQNLNKQVLSPGLIVPLMCKYFDWNKEDIIKKNQEQEIVDTVRYIRKCIEHYSNGASITAYHFLLSILDYIGDYQLNKGRNLTYNQLSAGSWVDDYLGAVRTYQPFSPSDYVGKRSIDTALWIEEEERKSN